jgi:hypothetical protein
VQLPENVEARVGTAVIDKNELVAVAALQRLRDLVVQGLEVLLLIQQRHNYGKLGTAIVLSCFAHILPVPLSVSQSRILQPDRPFGNRCKISPDKGLSALFPPQVSQKPYETDRRE